MPFVAEAVVTAALELTAYHVTAAPPKDRPTRGRFEFRMNGVNASVEFRSEAARIDLNKASKDLLAGLFGALGAGANDAEEYADRIIGWRTPPPANSQDPEESLYRATGLGYGPRGAPFVHTAELALVAGLPPALVERAMPFVTVFSGRPEINVRDAAPEVIAALPGMTPEQLNAALGDRAIAHGPSIVNRIGTAQTAVTTEGSKAVRVTVSDDIRQRSRHAYRSRDPDRRPRRALPRAGVARTMPTCNRRCGNIRRGRS